MKVQSINNNYGVMNFGANIKFTNPHHLETMPNIYDLSRAKSILEQIEKKSPGTNILISYEKTYLPENSFLTAKNMKTGVVMRERITQNDYEKDFNDPQKSYGGCETLYNLLEATLNKSYLIHDDFWGKEEFPRSVNPKLHQVFA